MYSSGDMMDGMMEKDEFIAYFDEIYLASSIKSQLTATREDLSLWKEYWQAFNVIGRHITVVNRSYQLHLVDDNKEYF